MEGKNARRDLRFLTAKSGLKIETSPGKKGRSEGWGSQAKNFNDRKPDENYDIRAADDDGLE